MFTRERYIDGLILVSAMHCDISHTASGIIPLVRNFRSGHENATYFRPLFERNNAQDIAKRRLNFRANFPRKFTETKKEIRAFRSHYFCTILYHGRLSCYSCYENFAEITVIRGASSLSQERSIYVGLKLV